MSLSRLLQDTIPENLNRFFRWPKSMRWGQSGDFTWVRPLRRIVCLLDGEVVPITIGPVTASNLTEGHRVHAPGAFPVTSATDWAEKLHAHYVIVDQTERRRLVADGLAKAAAAHNLTVAPDDGLLDEVTGLVEWPVPLIGQIGAEFMDLPPEVRELSMKVNQKYFALRDAAGKPAPYFAFMANLEAPDGGATIIAGNERVLRARLSDARHFWDLDLKTPLETLLPKLDKITFHAKIGSQGARAERIRDLAGDIAHALGADGNAFNYARDAGLLCKSDLVTGMVGEFPELQGIMGGYYAERNFLGEKGKIIGNAIKTHYQPKGPNDAVPRGIVSESVALADKLDTLKEFFKIGEKPTGSGDPYALRRAALGVIRILTENQRPLKLKSFLGWQHDLKDFIFERLRVKIKSDGQRTDIFDAVLATDLEGDLSSILQKTAALSEFLETPAGRDLLTAYQRAVNILVIEDKADGPHVYQKDLPKFGTQQDHAFYDAIEHVGDDKVQAFNKGDFLPLIQALSTLHNPVKTYFTEIFINEPEFRHRRLQLLARLRDKMHRIADFSKIVVTA
jgi:glycyl-tRNA synthetase beta chain